MWQKLVQAYALRSREYSDTVACLGSCPEDGPELSELLDEINRRKMLCDGAADELNCYVVSHPSTSGEL
jgi:hypothetical protein